MLNNYAIQQISWIKRRAVTINLKTGRLFSESIQSVCLVSFRLCVYIRTLRVRITIRYTKYYERVKGH